LEFRGLMGGFYRICEWIMRLSVTNVLWALCAFPIFFIALVILIGIQTNGPESAIPWLFLMAVISPFLLFPSTAAMFSVARKWIMGDTDVPLIKTFFKGYKENYVQSMLGGIVFLLLGAVMYMNYWFYLKQAGGLQWIAFLFITFSFILAASVINFFSIMVHFHMKFWNIIKNSILITIGHPLTSLSLLIVNLLIIYISLFEYTFLIPFFMGSLIATYSFWMFNRVYIRLQAKQESLIAKRAEENESGEAQDGSVNETKENGDNRESR